MTVSRREAMALVAGAAAVAVVGVEVAKADWRQEPYAIIHGYGDWDCRLYADDSYIRGDLLEAMVEAEWSGHAISHIELSDRVLPCLLQAKEIHSDFVVEDGVRVLSFMFRGYPIHIMR